MDGINKIGMGYSHLGALGRAAARPLSTPAPQDSAPGAPQDQIEISTASHAASSAVSTIDARQSSSDAGRTQIASLTTPSTLMPHGSGLSRVGAEHPAHSLGVLAQFDEPVVHEIQDRPTTQAAASLHMVGPGNAHEFLANPSRMYLGM